ncbi:MAG: helix-turn-helix domain-containing protein [Dethiobacteria bacterium]|jgi:excisionase family DNA binding protein
MKENIEIITGPEVAAFLRIGRVKAYELMKTGEIPSFRVGKRSIRTTRQALVNYIERSQKTG